MDPERKPMRHLLEESEATLAELADRDDPALFPLLARVQATVLQLRALLRSPCAP
ncbi:MAG TPA: hypothetical protein VK874_03035 [Gaiellaceae bacterium]|nr:hypothetical protein [Gaiellaceae bacterium]